MNRTSGTPRVWRVWFVDDLGVSVISGIDAFAVLHGLSLTTKTTRDAETGETIYRTIAEPLFPGAPHLDQCTEGEATMAAAYEWLDLLRRETFPDLAVFDIKLDGTIPGSDAVNNSKPKSIADVLDSNARKRLEAMARRMYRSIEDQYDQLDRHNSVFEDGRDYHTEWQGTKGNRLRDIEVALGLQPAAGGNPSPSELLTHGGLFLSQILLAKAHSLGVPPPRIVFVSGSHTALTSMLPVIVAEGHFLFEKGGAGMGSFLTGLLEERARLWIATNRSGHLAQAAETLARCLERVAVAANPGTKSSEDSPFARADAIENAGTRERAEFFRMATEPLEAEQDQFSLASLLPHVFKFLGPDKETINADHNKAAWAATRIRELFGAPGYTLRDLMLRYPWQCGIHWFIGQGHGPNPSGDEDKRNWGWETEGRELLLRGELDRLREHFAENSRKLARELSPLLQAVGRIDNRGGFETQLVETLADKAVQLAKEASDQSELDAELYFTTKWPLQNTLCRTDLVLLLNRAQQSRENGGLSWKATQNYSLFLQSLELPHQLLWYWFANDAIDFLIGKIPTYDAVTRGDEDWLLSHALKQLGDHVGTGCWFDLAFADTVEASRDRRTVDLNVYTPREMKARAEGGFLLPAGGKGGDRELLTCCWREVCFQKRGESRVFWAKPNTRDWVQSPILGLASWQDDVPGRMVTKWTFRYAVEHRRQ